MAAVSEESIPKLVLVRGAGENGVNGVYSFAKIYNDRGMYKKRCVWQGEHQDVALYRYKIGYNEFRWYISIFPSGGDPSGGEDIDFYKAVETEEESGPIFPTSRWESFALRGLAPAPTVSVIATETPHYWHEIRTATVLKPFAVAHEKMFLSEDFSDVKLVCRDSVALPAHKCILAASSSYFSAAFAGPWKENDIGELKISHPSHIMKEVLRMLYAGDVSSAYVVKEDPVPFLSIAAEFDFPWLKEMAEKACFESIDKNNLKDLWQTGRMYECETLKNHCVEYAKANSLAVLAHGGITDLRTVDPSSWDEFANGLEEKDEN